jgi:hypothetical protein
MERITYINDTLLNTKTFDILPQETIEQEMILELLKKIPLEKLKKIVNVHQEWYDTETIKISCSISI